jgi:SsrA-binding protein
MAEGEKGAGKPRMIATNRRATFEYHVLEELECGIALTGTEVKSLRAKECSIAEAFGMVRNGEMWLLGMHIPEYAQGNVHNHAPARDRKLLLHKKEIQKWHAQVKERGMTIVPLAIYFKGSRAKVAIALCKGKKLYDKREDKRAKDDKREMDRAMSRGRRGG